MSGVDEFKDARVEYSIRAWEIDPCNLDVIRGEISGIVPDGCSITEGYYSDTRVSASLKTIDSSITYGSWIRIAAEDSDGNVEELGTFAMGSPTRKVHDGENVITEYKLHSAIWAISETRSGTNWTISKGTKTSTAIKAVCNSISRQYVTYGGFNDYTSQSPVSYEVGDSFSSILFDICDRSNNRMSVDSHGRLSFSPYNSPSTRGADWYIDERDDRSIVISGSQVVEESYSEACDRSIVVWKGRLSDNDKDDTEIIGKADVSSSHIAYPGRRGFSRSFVHVESDMSPQTQARATQLAKQYLSEDSYSPRNAEITVMWFPVHAGDILYRYDQNGVGSKWLVQTVDANLHDWTKKLTLKEAV